MPAQHSLDFECTPEKMGNGRWMPTNHALCSEVKGVRYLTRAAADWKIDRRRATAAMSGNFEERRKRGAPEIT